MSEELSILKVDDDPRVAKTLMHILYKRGIAFKNRLGFRF